MTTQPELLCRARRKDNNEWVEGEKITNGNGEIFVISEPMTVLTCTHKTSADKTDLAIIGCFEIIRESLQVSTGRRDKHGKKIFGGMRVDAWTGGNNYIGCVEWVGCCWILLGQDFGVYRDIEIIPDESEDGQ